MENQILQLRLKKKWFDMILSGEKKEEYRDIKPFWAVRLMSSFYVIDGWKSAGSTNDNGGLP